MRRSLRDRWEKAAHQRRGRKARKKEGSGGEGRAGRDAVSRKPGRQSRFKRSWWEVCITCEIKLHREGRTPLRRARPFEAVQNYVTDNGT